MNGMLASSFYIFIAIISHAIAAPFGGGNLVALRFGPNGVSGSVGQGPVYLDEISLNPLTFGVVIQSIALPNTLPLTGNQNMITGEFSFSQGGLWRSENGQYISFSGWNTTVSASTPGVTGSGTIAVCSYDGVCDTSITTNSATAVPPGIGGDNMRSSVTNDGINFWTSGTKGLEYEIKPATVLCPGLRSCNTLIEPVNGAAAFNYRHMVLQNGQLYASTQGSPIYGIVTYGTPNPTTPNGTSPTTVFLAPTGAASQIHGFAFVNQNTIVYGDRAAGTSGGGITAFSRVNASSPFTLQWQYVIATGAQYVHYDPCTGRIYFTSTEASSNFIYYIPYSATLPTAQPVVVWGNVTGSFIRGMVMTPVAPTAHAGACYTPQPAIPPTPSGTPFTGGNLALLVVGGTGDVQLNNQGVNGSGCSGSPPSCNANYVDHVTVIEITRTGQVVQIIPLQGLPRPSSTRGSWGSDPTGATLNCGSSAWTGGTGPSELLMTMSTDGRYLHWGCYDAVYGVDQIDANATGWSAPRVAFRMGVSGVPEVTGYFANAFTTDTFRSVCSYDGSTIYTVGHGGGVTADGLMMHRYSGTASTSAVSLNAGTLFTNGRGCQVVKNKLSGNVPALMYSSNVANPVYSGVGFAVNGATAYPTQGTISGLPTSAPVDLAVLPGFPLPNEVTGGIKDANPNNFVFTPGCQASLTGTCALFIADSNPITNCIYQNQTNGWLSGNLQRTCKGVYAGLQKYTYNPVTGNWTLVQRITYQSVPDLTGAIDPVTGNFVIYFTTVNVANNQAVETYRSSVMMYDTVTGADPVEIFRYSDVFHQIRGIEFTPGTANTNGNYNAPASPSRFNEKYVFTLLMCDL
jgi:hypothetical protein